MAEERVNWRGVVSTVMNTAMYLWVLYNVRDLVTPQNGFLEDQGRNGAKAIMK